MDFFRVIVGIKYWMRREDSCISAVPGASCSAGQTCSGNSICVASFCVCPGGEKIRDGQCVSVDSQVDSLWCYLYLERNCKLNGVTTSSGTHSSLYNEQIFELLSNNLSSQAVIKIVTWTIILVLVGTQNLLTGGVQNYLLMIISRRHRVSNATRP